MWNWGARSYARFAVDLACVALSPVIALLIRDNFVTAAYRLEALVPYALLSTLAGAMVFTLVGLPRSLWRYTSLTEILQLIAVITAVLLIAVSASFYLNRMQNVARSLPAIQWFILVAAMAGSRIAVRLSGERATRGRSQSASGRREHVLIVGVSDVTELYLRSVDEFAHGWLAVVGILAGERQLRGRSIRSHKVLGTPENIQGILSELDLHGVTVERIAVMQPFEQLSKDAQEALLVVERSSAIRVDWLVEKLGLRPDGASGAPETLKAASDKGENQPPSVLEANQFLLRGRYHHIKRAIDGAAAVCVTLALAPFLALVALVVAIDIGFPLVFWQQRPGKHGYPFKLFKFRTMRAAHNADGKRIPDQLRSSTIGDFMRRSRLDELPQLYNILLGEMSFVGPRPLLPVDQPQWQNLRLLVRPGLTGWAQVNGGRDISPEDKAALDIWYIMNASPWLDITILLRTLVMMVLGERLDRSALQTAHLALEKMRTSWAAKSLPTLLPDANLVVSTRAVHEAR